MSFETAVLLGRVFTFLFALGMLFGLGCVIAQWLRPYQTLNRSSFLRTCAHWFDGLIP